MGLIWKRDHTLVRQHSIHLFAFYTTEVNVGQRRQAIADHWIHTVTHDEGACARLYPNPHNKQHLLTPSLDEVQATSSDARHSLCRQLRALANIDRLTYLAYPEGVMPHGTWERDVDEKGKGQ
ncbi:MAG: hypothetical protein U5L98_06550 [Halomonas sp.]|uniref:hypothetical protein n=1 Tax=Halomonas sp. TaxID=1486246 RepID=UPI002ACE5484|nr:hypothetical protein [Halomonas sp.]MDZ7852303.1 hypothetical protein [Halomonas sp.]